MENKEETSGLGLAEVWNPEPSGFLMGSRGPGIGSIICHLHGCINRELNQKQSPGLAL